MWIGGSFFFATVVRPVASHSMALQQVMPILGTRYREIVEISAASLAVTGIILMVSRISGQDASIAWFIVLGIKLAAALWLFAMVWRIRRRRSSSKASPETGKISSAIGYQAIIAVGVFIFLLASLLRLIVEKG